MSTLLTQSQRDDAVRLVQDGHSTAAVARLMNCSRRRIQELVLIAEESSEAEIGEARDAYRALVAQRGERLPMTPEEKSALLDDIFGTDEELAETRDELFGFDPTV